MPKKRGPKTDVLEALLKRVDGLEAKLKEKKERPPTPTSDNAPLTAEEALSSSSSSSAVAIAAKAINGDDGESQSRPDVDMTRVADVTDAAVYTPSENRYGKSV